MEKEKNYIEVPSSVEGLQPAIDFIRNTLERRKVRANSSYETLLLFEELFMEVIETGSSEDETIRVTFHNTFGNMSFDFSFAGERFFVDLDSGDSMDPRMAILRSYDDRYSFSYRRRINTVSLQCKGSNKIVGKVGICVAITLGVFLLLKVCLTPDQLTSLGSSFLLPAIGVYVTAVLMISAPVTFFSLVKNISDVSIKLDRKLNVKQTILGIGVISISAIAIAIVFYYILGGFCLQLKSNYNLNFGVEIVEELPGISEILLTFVPSDILQAFTLINPVPLIFLAILTAASLCLMDKHFYTVKDINDGLYRLSCKMLGIIIWFLPLVAILAALYLLIKIGMGFVVIALISIGIAFISVLIMYTIRLIILKTKGVKVISFVKTCLPLLIENFNINSSIDAVPFNTRFCNSVLKIKRDRLEVYLPVFAQISLSGNCLIITLFSLVSTSIVGINLSFDQVLMIGFLVLALSLGAPNQPGSVFIGMAVIFSYCQIPIEGMITIALMEVLLGRFVALQNTMSDIISIYSMELKSKKTKKS